MADPFWDPIFAKLSKDFDLLRLMAFDTPDRSLLAWAKPNPPLLKAVAPFVKNQKIVSRGMFIEHLIQASSEDEALGRIIFFNWISGNHATMSFTSCPVDEKTFDRLKSGEFGRPEKIMILSRIDPRESPKATFAEFREWYELQKSANQENSQVPPPQKVPEKDDDLNEIDQTSHFQTEISQLREEARDLRKKVKDLEKHKTEIEKRLSEKGSDLASLQKRIPDLEERNKRLADKVKFFEDEVKARPSVATEPPALMKNPDPSDVEEYARRVKTLETVLERRDASIERLTDELGKMKEEASGHQKAADAADRLQKLYQGLEKEFESWKKMRIGRLMVKMCEGRKDERFAIFECVDGERIVLTSNLVSDIPAVEGEWIGLIPHEDGRSPEFFLFEKKLRREIIGTIVEMNGNFFLESDEGSFPILCLMNKIEIGTVAAGIFLSALADRPEGIYSIRKIPVPEEKKEPMNFISTPGIKKYFGLDGFDRNEFVQILNNLEIKFSPGSEGFTFCDDFRRILPGLRLHLPVPSVCRKTGCLDALKKPPFFRFIRPDEVCPVCLEDADASQEALHSPQISFTGEKILIAGGDFVGKNYCRKLEGLNLKPEWISGFEGLGGLKSGLGTFDLVIVILKQISHTLLREILLSLRGSKVPLVYSHRRGISGILKLLEETLGRR